ADTARPASPARADAPLPDNVRNELHQLKAALEARETELVQLRESAERMGVMLQQRLDAAVADAQAIWKREEAARLDGEKLRLEEQFGHRLAEREMRTQAIADIAREQQASALRLLRQEFAATKDALAARDSELAASRTQLERLRKDWEAEIASTKAAMQAKASETLRAAETTWQIGADKALAELKTRQAAETASVGAAKARAETELAALRGHLERLRRQSETELAAARAALETKAAETLKAAQAEWQTQAHETLAAMTARCESAEAALAGARGGDRDSEVLELRGALEKLRQQSKAELAAAKTAAEAKAAEVLKAAQAGWQARSDKALAAMTERCEAAEAALGNPATDRDAEVQRLQGQLDTLQKSSEAEIAAVKKAAETREAQMLKAAETEWRVRSDAAIAEMTARCEAAETAAAATDSTKLVAEREAEVQHLRAEIERLAAVKAAAEAQAEIKAEERLKTAQARWEKTAAAALADTVGRCEAAEAALEVERRAAAKRMEDDEYVHTLEREIKTLRATLVDREAVIAGAQAMREHERLGTVREAPGRSWQPLSNRPTIGEPEPSEREKSNRRLLRDAGVVVMAAAAAVLLFPKLEAMLPDTVRWQIETAGGLFAPPDVSTTAPVTAPAAIASTQVKVEHPRMFASRSINVRAEPSVTAAIAANLKRGAPVAILEKRGSWDRVEIAAPAGAQPAQGWVFNSYLSETDPSAAVAAPAAAVGSGTAAPAATVSANPPAPPVAAPDMSAGTSPPPPATASSEPAPAPAAMPETAPATQ
ncbi:MAG: SH3 domain-containing protein, partial [Rhizomicrobium sp.]